MLCWNGIEPIVIEKYEFQYRCRLILKAVLDFADHQDSDEMKKKWYFLSMDSRKMETFKKDIDGRF